MSNNQQPTDHEPKSFAMVKSITSHAQALKALASKSFKCLDVSTLQPQFTSTINLIHAVNTSKNLTDEYHTMVSQTKGLTIEHNAAMTDHNTL
jgi:hypothetical protein